jgi:hypothetical protein
VFTRFYFPLPERAGSAWGERCAIRGVNRPPRHLPSLQTIELTFLLFSISYALLHTTVVKVGKSDRLTILVVGSVGSCLVLKRIRRGPILLNRKLVLPRSIFWKNEELFSLLGVQMKYLKTTPTSETIEECKVLLKSVHQTFL